MSITISFPYDQSFETCAVRDILSLMEKHGYGETSFYFDIEAEQSVIIFGKEEGE